MKVVLIPSSVEPVGVAVHVLNLARLLRAINLLGIVICPGEGWLSEQLRQEGIRYEILPLSYKPLSFLRSNLVLFQFLKKKKTIQIVHLHGRFPLFVSLLSMLTLKHLEFVVTVHQFCAAGKGGLFGWKNRLETLIWRYLVKRISCVSEALKEEVTKRLGSRFSSKVVVIRNWIQPIENYDVSRLDAHLDSQEKTFKIVAIGRLAKEKGFDILIDAIRILIERGVKARCDIFGEGPERAKLASQISKYGLNSIVQLKGVHDNVRRLLPLYDLLVVPSRTESFGIVVLEAYDAGIPVIASDIPGVKEIVQDGKTGLLFTPCDSESLAQKIICLINSPELLNSIVRQGKELVKHYLPDEKLIIQYLKFYGFQR